MTFSPGRVLLSLFGPACSSKNFTQGAALSLQIYIAANFRPATSGIEGVDQTSPRENLMAISVSPMPITTTRRVQPYTPCTPPPPPHHTARPRSINDRRAPLNCSFKNPKSLFFHASPADRDRIVHAWHESLLAVFKRTRGLHPFEASRGIYARSSGGGLVFPVSRALRASVLALTGRRYCCCWWWWCCCYCCCCRLAFQLPPWCRCLVVTVRWRAHLFRRGGAAGGTWLKEMTAPVSARRTLWHVLSGCLSLALAQVYVTASIRGLGEKYSRHQYYATAQQ